MRVRGASGLAAGITPAAAVELGLHTGAQVWFVVKATEVALYPQHDKPGSNDAAIPDRDAPTRAEPDVSSG